MKNFRSKFQCTSFQSMLFFPYGCFCFYSNLWVRFAITTECLFVKGPLPPPFPQIKDRISIGSNLKEGTPFQFFSVFEQGMTDSQTQNQTLNMLFCLPEQLAGLIFRNNISSTRNGHPNMCKSENINYFLFLLTLE